MPLTGRIPRTLTAKVRHGSATSPFRPGSDKGSLLLNNKLRLFTRAARE